MSENRPTPPSVPLLFAMVTAAQLALSIFLPAVPDIAVNLQTSLTAAQSLVPIYFAAFSLAQLVIGPLSDKYGRRPVIICGMALFTLACIACAVAPSIEVLLTARAVQAVGACTTMVVCRAMIRDTCEGAAAIRVMSHFALSLGLGVSIAPLCGGFLTTWFGWRATFFANGLASLIILAGVLIMLRETLPPDMRQPPRFRHLLLTYLRIALNLRFTGYMLSISFASGAVQTFMAAGPIVLISNMGIRADRFGFFVMFLPMCYMVGTYAARRLAAFLSVDQVILVGVAFSLTGGVLQFAFGLIAINAPIPVLAAVATSNFGTGFIIGNCYAQALATVPPSIAGSASALGGFMQWGWAFLVALLVANLTHTSSLQMGSVHLATTILAFCMALILMLVIKRKAG
ncbi:MAG: multidrug effflux MFS transporter [Rhizobiales bacterium]|nr:multidrug effflux MFS transporter [Hyphomicrobiales bacterium]